MINNTPLAHFRYFSGWQRPWGGGGFGSGRPFKLLCCILPETVSSMSACSSPCLFLTKHWYIPRSECVRPLIVKLPLLKWCLSVSLTSFPLKYHLYRTAGNPKATHERTTDEFDVTLCGLMTHSGLATKIKILYYVEFSEHVSGAD